MKTIQLLGIAFVCYFQISAFNCNAQGQEKNAAEWISTANNKGFIENQGQMIDEAGNSVSHVLYKTEAPNLNIWITDKGLTIQTLNFVEKEKRMEGELAEQNQVKKKEDKVKIYWERVDIDLKGATILKENSFAEGVIQGHSNYFNPNCPNGIYEVHEYEKLTFREIYPGIDWVLYRKISSANSSSEVENNGFKYDFIVHPGADYSAIEILYKSKSPVEINALGDLVMHTEYGKVKENAPVSFLESNEIATQFVLNYQTPVSINGAAGYETSISFLVDAAFETQNSSLIIDPQLTWATFYGGNNLDGPTDVDTDASGNVFVTGYVVSPDFPTQDPAGGAYFLGVAAGSNDVFILKFSNLGTRIWSTYYGGTGADLAMSITCDPSDNIFVTGSVGSNDFPIFDPAGGAYFQPANIGGPNDAFILKFSNAGVRLWATYYGGSFDEQGNSITCDPSGNVFITGETISSDFPILDPGGGAYYQPTNAGGPNEAFILEFTNTGVLVWGTYYGGTGLDAGQAIVCDASGNVFVTGITKSFDFPLTAPVGGAYSQPAFSGGAGLPFDAFILKFTNAGARIWTTYYGGTGQDRDMSIECDVAGNIILTGETSSTNLAVLDPGNGAYYQPANAGGTDIFILKFDNAGVRLWATYFGGSGTDDYFSVICFSSLATTSCGEFYVGFTTTSSAATIPLQAPCGSGTYFDNTFGGARDQFLAFFSYPGALLWSSYVGGNGSDIRPCLATDVNDNLFVAGEFTGAINEATYTLADPGGGAFFDATANGTDDGSLLRFAYPFCCATLPISLVSFTANCLAENVKINWVTATETNNSHFTIERGVDGVNFSPIATVDGMGNSTSLQEYSYSDRIQGNSLLDENVNLIYYRLKQTDFDGKFEYSKTTVVEYCPNGSMDDDRIAIFPNPSNGVITISTLGDDELEIKSIEIFNAVGELIYEDKYESSLINLADKTDGIYFITITTSAGKFIKKIVIVR